nr:MAG TPA: hypothetical protein [Microviridae sp.]
MRSKRFCPSKLTTKIQTFFLREDFVAQKQQEFSVFCVLGYFLLQIFFLLFISRIVLPYSL